MTKETARPDIVPGKMRCAKCGFTLQRVTLYVRTGNSGAGDNTSEPCPNGCGPLWPQTWQQEATELGERLEQMFNEKRDAVVRTDRLTPHIEALEAALRKCVAIIESDCTDLKDGDTVPGQCWNPSDADASTVAAVTAYEAAIAQGHAALNGAPE